SETISRHTKSTAKLSNNQNDFPTFRQKYEKTSRKYRSTVEAAPAAAVFEAGCEPRTAQDAQYRALRRTFSHVQAVRCRADCAVGIEINLNYSFVQPKEPEVDCP